MIQTYIPFQQQQQQRQKKKNGRREIGKYTVKYFLFVVGVRSGGGGLHLFLLCTLSSGPLFFFGGHFTVHRVFKISRRKISLWHFFSSSSSIIIILSIFISCLPLEIYHAQCGVLSEYKISAHFYPGSKKYNKRGKRRVLDK